VEALEAVEVVAPYYDDIRITTSLSGKLNAIEEVMIIPEIPSKVTSLRVELGDRVSRGDILFVLDDEAIRNQIQQAEAAYNLASKSLQMQMEQIQNARINFERIEKLYNEGAVSKQQYEQAKLTASDAQVNQSKVALDLAKSQLDKTVVTAPIDGYVAAITIKEKEYASNVQPAMRIVNTDKFLVKLGVSEDMVVRIKPGDKVNVKVNTIDENIEGIVKAVSPIPDDMTQIYPVEIEIPNTNNMLKAGMFAEIVIDLEKVENALIIPRSAVFNKDGKEYVYKVENDTAVLTEVKTGIDDGNNIEIMEGLSEADRVIVKGQDFIEDGEKVRVVRGDQ